VLWIPAFVFSFMFKISPELLIWGIVKIGFG